MNLRTPILAALLALGAGCGTLTPSTSKTPAAAGVLTSVPLEVLNPDVRQETIHQTICVPGYTASVRPSSAYTNGVKVKLLREQGLPTTRAVDYELDHKLPLAIGGHPRNLKNLELQAWGGHDGAKRKDQLERALQRRVCDGRMPLAKAQAAIFFDWQAAYRELHL